MKIQPKQIKVRDLYEGYKDSGDAGVLGYRGQLNIRPAYQVGPAKPSQPP